MYIQGTIIPEEAEEFGLNVDHPKYAEWLAQLDWSEVIDIHSNFSIEEQIIQNFEDFIG